MYNRGFWNDRQRENSHGISEALCSEVDMGSVGYSQYSRQSLAAYKRGIYVICQRLVQCLKEKRSCGKIAFFSFPWEARGILLLLGAFVGPAIFRNKMWHRIVKWYLCDCTYQNCVFSLLQEWAGLQDTLRICMWNMTIRAGVVKKNLKWAAALYPTWSSIPNRTMQGQDVYRITQTAINLLKILDVNILSWLCSQIH